MYLQWAWGCNATDDGGGGAEGMPVEMKSLNKKAFFAQSVNTTPSLENEWYSQSSPERHQAGKKCFPALCGWNLSNHRLCSASLQGVAEYGLKCCALTHTHDVKEAHVHQCKGVRGLTKQGLMGVLNGLLH